HSLQVESGQEAPCTPACVPGPAATVSKGLPVELTPLILASAMPPAPPAPATGLRVVKAATGDEETAVFDRPDDESRDERLAGSKRLPRLALSLFVASVIAAGVALSLLGWLVDPSP